MKKVIERIVKSPGAPGTHDLWLTEDNELKVYDNEEWKTLAGGGGSDGGGSSEITLAQAWTRAFKIDKKPTFDNHAGTVTHSEEPVPLPDFVMFAENSSIYDVQGLESRPLEDEGLVLPDNVTYPYYLYEANEDSVQDSYKIVPFDDFDESDFVVDPEYTYSGCAYFLYKLNELSNDFHGSLLSVERLVSFLNFHLGYYDCVYIIEYKGEYYFTNGYEGD